MLQVHLGHLFLRLLNGCRSLPHLSCHFFILSHKTEILFKDTSLYICNEIFFSFCKYLKNVRIAIEPEIKCSDLGEQSHSGDMSQRYTYLHIFLQGVPNQRPRYISTRQHNLLVNILVLTNDISRRKTSLLNVDKLVIIHIVHGFLTVDFSITCKYYRTLKNMTRKCPYQISLKKNCRNRWCLCRYVSTEINAHWIFHTCSVPNSFTTGSHILHNNDFSKGVERVSFFSFMILQMLFAARMSTLTNHPMKYLTFSAARRNSSQKYQLLCLI